MNFLFLIGLGFGANYFQPEFQQLLTNQESSETFNIPGTLRMIGIMVEFPLEYPDHNSKTSGDGTFLDQNYEEYINFYNTDTDRCSGFLVDTPPHNTLYFQKQLDAVGNYYKNISMGNLPFTADMISNSNIESGYYTVSQDMEYYAKGDSLLARFFSEALDLAKSDIEDYFIGKEFSPDDVVFVVFHAGIGQDFSYPFLDPTIYDLKSAYIDDKMMQDIIPTIISHNNNSYQITTGVLLPETQNIIYYNVVEDIYGNSEDFCDIQVGLTGIFSFLLGYELGLPPMFNNDPNSISFGEAGLGYFGLMDHGSNNGRGVIPAVPNPWTRIKAGWSEIENINSFNISSNPILITALNQSNKIYQIDISESEYFLIENRNNHIIPGYDIEYLRNLLNDNYLCNNCDLNCNGMNLNEIIDSFEVIEECVENHPFTNDKLHYFDLIDTLIKNIDDPLLSINSGIEGNIFADFNNYDIGLPGSGILIWHINEPLESDYSSGVNNDRDNRAIAIEEADGALDIGFESYLFFSNSNSFGWRWDYWYKDNPAYNEANSMLEKTIFNNISHPNTRTADGAESFLSIEILSDISTSMYIDVHIADGIEIVNLSDDPINYLGNSVYNSKGSVYYEKQDIIYKHSFDAGMVPLDNLNYIEGNII